MTLKDKAMKEHIHKEKQGSRQGLECARNLIHGMLVQDSTFWGLPPTIIYHAQMKRSPNASWGSRTLVSSVMTCSGSWTGSFLSQHAWLQQDMQDRAGSSTYGLSAKDGTHKGSFLQGQKFQMQYSVMVGASYTHLPHTTKSVILYQRREISHEMNRILTLRCCTFWWLPYNQHPIHPLPFGKENDCNTNRHQRSAHPCGREWIPPSFPSLSSISSKQ